MGRRSAGTRALSTVIATLLAWSPVVPWLGSHARAQEHAPTSGVEHEIAAGARTLDVQDTVTREVLQERGIDPDGVAELPENVIDQVATEVADRLHVDADGVPGEGEIMPLSLPGGETRTSVNPQSISLPTAEGTIEGMGESFTPQLSSGTGTFSVPLAVAPGRAGVQPSLTIAYSSSGGNGAVGFGWGFSVPFISRQTDRGLPGYDDRSAWHAAEDRLIYNGGQELVPVDTAAMAAIDAPAAGLPASTVATVPSDVVGWQQYRARVEGGFMRFFRSPDWRRWVVQGRDGTRFDFGALPTGQGASDLDSTTSIEQDDEGGTHVFRWMITRSSDSHGSTIYYRYRRDRGQLYVDDVYYTSPAGTCGVLSTPAARMACTAPLGAYGAHVHFVYGARDDAFTTYTSGYPITTALRLRRVEMTAFDDATLQRALVRRYHFTYDATSFHSLLTSVQVEGRPSTADSLYGFARGSRSVPEASLLDAIIGDLLPPMRFQYTRLPSSTSAISGFGSLSNTVVDIPGSPPNSIDEARTELFDVNSDGLPDVLVTDPARYRGSDGGPATGVFFNGFQGSGVRPGTAGGFGAAVSVPMPAGLSGALSFANLNIVPMDIDGDGRSDLLHMPRARTYGWFTPTRQADVDGAEATSPRGQGWRFSYAEIDLPSSDLDPRIDFGRDGQHLQVLDVNNDHLIDVVRTTGTVMQTWLNLGWLDGGDGRFGSFSYGSSGRPVLSTQPYESCLLQSGTAVDFDGAEVRLADMNGDGLQDIVELQRGRVRYWPGRGLGSWGTGTHDCSRGAGANRYVEMATPPRDLAVDLQGVTIADIDGDGASDLVQVRFDAIDVWFNRAGSSWTERLIINGTPAAPSFLNRVRFVDMDGSGTLDAVYGTSDRWQYVNLLADRGGVATRPRLLRRVENGLGAVTELEYGSSATDYLRDLAEAERCGASCEHFVWSETTGDPSQRLQALSGGRPADLYRASGTPVISTVVRSVRTSDQFELLGREGQNGESSFAYHDGYYEGIEQEFRGFGAADARVAGGSHSESGGVVSEDTYTRTWFHQGRRAQRIADDRLAWNPDEALKGREYLTEIFDAAGRFLSTSHATLTTRLLANGLDGRPIQYAFVSETNEIQYDTTPFSPTSDTLELPTVRREYVTAATGALNGSLATSDPPRALALRGDRRARIQTTFDDVDNQGQVRQQTAHGRVAVALTVGGTDDAILSHAVPELLNSAGQWIWRTQRAYVTGSEAPSLLLGDTTTSFDSDDGDAHSTVSTVTAGVPGYVFDGDPSGQGGAMGFGTLGSTLSLQNVEATTYHDAWGNVVGSCGGDARGEATAATSPPYDCLRFGTVAYDAAYQQFPLSETAWVAPYGALQTLTTTVPMTPTSDAGWDRGLGAVRRVADPNGTESRVEQDGLGRATASIPPSVRGCTAGAPAATIAYELTGDPSVTPASRVVTTSYLTTSGCYGSDDTDTLVSMGVVDGLGRVRATLSQGDDGATWIRGGLSRLDVKGQAVESWQAGYYTGSASSIGSIVSLSAMTVPSTHAHYDAFGRVVHAIAEDLSLTVTSYHATSADVCDPLDNAPGDVAEGTCTTSRSDGHGRVIDQILRQRVMVGGAVELHRLWSYYRADGSVTALVRARTPNSGLRPDLSMLPSSDRVMRTFYYDSVGRRLGSDDADTDDMSSGTQGSRTWRYLFNRVGDLTAVRDPRGCGQNFIYDLGGRLLGEQYVGCTEAQTTVAELPVDDVPGGSISLVPIANNAMVDVRYEYDADPTWMPSGSMPPSGAAGRLGRATGVSDRGQRSAVAYDLRGDVIWTARQMALMPAAPALPAGSLSGNYPTLTETAPTSGSVAYDEDHTYVRTASFDHAGRARAMTLPLDPDYGPGVPLVSGAMVFNHRGLPLSASVTIGSYSTPVIDSISYDRDGAVLELDYGNYGNAAQTYFEYDARRRPTQSRTVRTPTDGAAADTLEAVGTVAYQNFIWDAANNLMQIGDARDPLEWPVGHRPQSVSIAHDALYHATGADFFYQNGGSSETDVASDWRGEAAASNAADPMAPTPAPRVGALPPDRTSALDWSWDWLGNNTSWNDDADSFYERSAGRISNGVGDTGLASATSPRPSALYLASTLPTTANGLADGTRDGWVEVQYGVSGNVTSYTVHGACDDTTTNSCWDDTSLSLSSRISQLRAGCTCGQEQHYDYRWDELNRMVDARRYDRAGGSWTYGARIRTLYDGANQRTVKESFSAPNTTHRYALYVYLGDFERRGLTQSALTYDAVTTAPATETQYVVAGARIVWDSSTDVAPGSDLDRNRRITLPITDLLGTSSAVIDLASFELLESSTYYPNGARENLWTSDLQAVPLEPSGFTGKEADEEVGATYFGERWLISRLGRWASPDPLHVHANGGGEVLNSYHYVGGNVLQTRDPLGLQTGVTRVEATPLPSSDGRMPESARVRVGDLEIEAMSHARVEMMTELRSGTMRGHQTGVWIGVRGPSARDTSIVQTVSLRAESRRGPDGAWRGYRGGTAIEDRRFRWTSRRGSPAQIDGRASDTVDDYDVADDGHPAGIGFAAAGVHGIVDNPITEDTARRELFVHGREHSVRITASFETYVRQWRDDGDGGGRYRIVGVVHWESVTVATRVRDQADGESDADYMENGFEVQTEEHLVGDSPIEAEPDPGALRAASGRAE